MADCYNLPLRTKIQSTTVWPRQTASIKPDPSADTLYPPVPLPPSPQFGIVGVLVDGGLSVAAETNE
jgi:hypothetical protein